MRLCEPLQGHAACLRNWSEGLAARPGLPPEGHSMSSETMESAWNFDSVRSRLRQAEEVHDLVRL